MDSGKWKLVSQFDPESKRVWELYDMISDRSESNNLLNDYGSQAKLMFQEYVRWAQKNNVRDWKEVSQKLKEVQRRAAANIRRE